MNENTHLSGVLEWLRCLWLLWWPGSQWHVSTNIYTPSWQTRTEHSVSRGAKRGALTGGSDEVLLVSFVLPPSGGAVCVKCTWWFGTVASVSGPTAMATGALTAMAFSAGRRTEKHKWKKVWASYEHLINMISFLGFQKRKKNLRLLGDLLLLQKGIKRQGF